MRPGRGCAIWGAPGPIDQRTTACMQQLRDLLECAWPAALAAAAQPFDSLNWCAALAVVFDRCNGDPRTPGPPRPQAVRGRGASRAAPLGRPTGLAAHHRRGLHRAYRSGRSGSPTARRVGARPLGARRLAYCSRPGSPRCEPAWLRSSTSSELTDFLTSIPGRLRSRGGGHPGRDRRPHPLRQRPCPGQTRRAVPARGHQRHPHRPSRISRRGRPRLRLAAWRAVWGALPSNPVMAARYRHLTTRERNPTQRRTGQSGDRGSAAALDPRHRHPPRHLGSRHRRRPRAEPRRPNPRSTPNNRFGAKLHAA